MERMLAKNVPPENPTYLTVEKQELVKTVCANVVHAQERQGKYYNSNNYYNVCVYAHSDYDCENVIVYND